MPDKQKQAGDAIVLSNVSPGLTRGPIPVRVKKNASNQNHRAPVLISSGL
jgi:hypothetical protein